MHFTGGVLHFILIFIARFKETLDTIDDFIRAGQLKTAWTHVEPLLSLNPPPPDRIRIASFLRRINRAGRARAYLAPLVLGRGRTLPESSPLAKIEYAEILLNLGLVREARRFLLDPRTSELPLAKVRLGYSFLYENEHERAVAVLGDALSLSGAIAGYERAIVKTNWLLARAHVLVDHGPLRELHMELREFQRECLSQNYGILVHALHAVDLQIRFKLGRALPRISPSGTQIYSTLMVKLYELCIRNASIREFLNLRKEAETAKLFEVVREVDFKRGLVFRDQKLLGQVFEHSESRGFKQRLLREAETFGVKLEGPRKTKISVGGRGSLPLPPKLMRLLQLLSEERYAPLTSAMLWDRLMDEKHFRGESSGRAIHQWIHRLKIGLAESAETREVRIEWDQTGYRLSSADVGFEFPEAIAAAEKRDQNHGYLLWKERWSQNQAYTNASHSAGGVEISLSMLRARLPDVPTRTHQYYLNLGVERGDLIRDGKARATRYRPVKTKLG